MKYEEKRTVSNSWERFTQFSISSHFSSMNVSILRRSDIKQCRMPRGDRAKLHGRKEGSSLLSFVFGGELCTHSHTMTVSYRLWQQSKCIYFVASHFTCSSLEGISSHSRCFLDPRVGGTSIKFIALRFRLCAWCYALFSISHGNCSRITCSNPCWNPLLLSRSFQNWSQPDQKKNVE